MRILEINKFYYPRRGAERHFLDLVELLKQRGHRVEVFSMQHPKNLPSRFSCFFPTFVGYNAGEANFWQRLKGLGRLWSFEAQRKMQALLTEWRPEIVHIHNIYHQLSPSILKPLKKLHVPIIMTVHDYSLISPDKDVYYREVGRQYWRFLFVRKYSFFKRLLLVVRLYFEQVVGFYEKSIDRYIVPSLCVKDTLISAGLPEEKITVLPHFIAGSLEPLQENPATEKAFALYFGSLSEEKGVNGLVAVFDTLRIPLVIAGTVEPGFILKESGYVTTVGQKSQEELSLLIRKSACVVSASSLPETFGLIALEAIALGKPFFGLQSGAYPEIISNGNNGFLAENMQTLNKYVAEYFAGKHIFSSREIQKEAYEHFGEEIYIQKLEAIVAKMKKTE